MAPQTAPAYGIEDHGLRITRGDFEEAQFAEPWRYERVHGRLVVMAPAGFEHQRPANRFRDYLGAYALGHRQLVADVISEAWIVTKSSIDRIADIAVYLCGESDSGELQDPRRVPEIVFEVVSGGGEDRKRDYVDKRAEYLQIGVKEYVIIDRFLSRLTVLRRTRGRFVESQLGPNDVYTSPLMPGLEIPLIGIL